MDLIPKKETPRNALIGDRLLDTGRLVEMLVYEGRTLGEISKKLGTSVPSLRKHISQAGTQSLIEAHQKSRAMLMAFHPMANQATRMRRREGLYQEAEESQDRELQRKLLNDAALEMQRVEDLRVGAGQGSGGITVNVVQMESREGTQRAKEVRAEYSVQDDRQGS